MKSNPEAEKSNPEAEMSDIISISIQTIQLPAKIKWRKVKLSV
jgi:hypothetical protein